MVNNLKAIREDRGLTQNELAEAANIHRVTIAKYEAGQVDPTLENAKKMADVLGVTVDELIRQK